VGNHGEGDERCGFVEFKRKDMATIERVMFTWAEAKRAGLAGKDTYKSWGDDMLVWRAVGRFSKRYASDVLRGFALTETLGQPIRVQARQPERRALTQGPGIADPIFDAAESARLDAEIAAEETGKENV